MISIETLQRLSQTTGDLIYLGFGPDVRICSRGPLQAFSQTWMAADFTVQPEEVGQQGVDAIRINLTDTDFSWARRLRQEFRAGIACEWHLLYRGAVDWESELQFSGALEDGHINRDGTVDLTARTGTGHTAWSPRVPFESPHSLPRGSEIVINGATYRVE